MSDSIQVAKWVGGLASILPGENVAFNLSTERERRWRSPLVRALKRFHGETDPKTGEKKVVLDIAYRKTFPIRRDDLLATRMLELIEKHDAWL